MTELGFDIGDEMRRLVDEAEAKEKSEEGNQSKINKEEKDESSETKSEEVDEDADEGEGEGVSLSDEDSEDEGDESDGRKALEDALRGEEEEEESEEEDEEEESSQEEASTIEAPEHWPSEDRKMFSKLPVEGQKFLFNLAKHFQGDYMRKVNDIQGVKEALKPIDDMLTKNGLSHAQAVRSLVGDYLTIKENPAAGIKSMIGQYGVDINELIQNWDNIEELKPKVEETSNQELSEEDKATIQRRINEWAKDKEFAEQVEDEMALIVAGCNQRNQPIPHIDEVYSKACRMNEEVSKILDQRIGADKDASKAEEAKAKAIKAKKGKINRKSVKKRTEKKPASLSDELRAGLERAEAGG